MCLMRVESNGTHVFSHQARRFLSLLFTPIAGMVFAPVLDPLTIFRVAKVILVLRSLQPPQLAPRFALFAAGRFRAVALMTKIATIGTIKLFAA
jgi:hypothetical protein